MIEVADREGQGTRCSFDSRSRFEIRGCTLGNAVFSSLLNSAFYEINPFTPKFKT